MEIGIKGFAILGGVSVMILQLLLMKRFSSISILLLFGVVLSYFLSGGSEALVSISNADSIKSFVQWGFGNFDQVFGLDLWILSFLLLVNIISFWRYSSAMDVYGIGDSLATNTGLHVLRFRTSILFIAGASAGIITAYCGPIGFVGMVAPQFARLLSKSQSMKSLWLYSMLSGIMFCLLADVMNHYAFDHIQLSLNAMAALICSPIVAISLFRNKNLF
jgi:iron complex transport system permease protein